MKTLATVSATTYQRIKRDIILGKLAPATKLKLEDMRRAYDASTSTMRETLNRLASEGFVSPREQRGFFVTPVSREDLSEVADLRILLECHALELSVRKGDTEWEGNLVAAHHKLHLMEKEMLAGNLERREDWKRYDWEFHLATIAACGSSNLLALHSTLYDKYLRYQMLVLTYRGEEAVGEHREIYEASLERDAPKATKALRRHIERGLADTLSAFA